MPLALQHGVVERRSGSYSCSRTRLDIGRDLRIAHDFDAGVELDNLDSRDVELRTGLRDALALIVLHFVPKMKPVSAHSFLEPAAILEETAHAHYAASRHALHLGYVHISGRIRRGFKFGCEALINFYTHIGQQAAVRHEGIQEFCAPVLLHCGNRPFVVRLASAHHERACQNQIEQDSFHLLVVTYEFNDLEKALGVFPFDLVCLEPGLPVCFCSI